MQIYVLSYIIKYKLNTNVSGLFYYYISVIIMYFNAKCLTCTDTKQDTELILKHFN
jgi:hypothetical protein